MDQSIRNLSWRRIGWACLVAGAWAVLCYFLVEWARPDSGVVSVSFALIQPAAICAFIAYVGDPMARRGKRFYALVPVVSAVGMIAVAVVVLREGAVCIAMLAPIWMLAGMVGSLVTYSLRRRDKPQSLGDTFAAHGLLVLPIIAMVVESAIPVPVDHRTVVSETVIAAPAEEIWPLMEGMGQVDPDAGQWNVSQDVIGIPRPRLARLEGKGVGARRHARWDRGVHFDEVIDRWEAGRAIGWQFDFTRSDGWDITDPHLRPDGPYMRIVSGGYDLQPLGDGRHLLRLHTVYEARTHFNGYASLWGNLFLGDIQDNVLEVIRQRAEN